MSFVKIDQGVQILLEKTSFVLCDVLAFASPKIEFRRGTAKFDALTHSSRVSIAELADSQSRPLGGSVLSHRFQWHSAVEIILSC